MPSSLPSHSSPRPHAAFTTIEILIVIVILGITAAVAIPMIGDRSDLKLAAATRKAVADFQYAQNLSIAARDPIYVRFDLNQYTLFKRSGTTTITLTHPVDQMPFVVKCGTAPSASALASVTQPKPSFAGNSVVGFDTLGVPFLFNETTSVKSSMTSSGSVVLKCGTRQQSIVIEPYTGEISIP